MVTKKIFFITTYGYRPREYFSILIIAILHRTLDGEGVAAMARKICLSQYSASAHEAFFVSFTLVSP